MMAIVENHQHTRDGSVQPIFDCSGAKLTPMRAALPLNPTPTRRKQSRSFSEDL
jgi:hypothetical protein